MILLLRKVTYKTEEGAKHFNEHLKDKANTHLLFAEAPLIELYWKTVFK